MRVVAIVSFFRYKTRALAVRSQTSDQELTALRDERKQLEARIQNLESIVCSVDLELNARLAAPAGLQVTIFAELGES